MGWRLMPSQRWDNSQVASREDVLWRPPPRLTTIAEAQSTWRKFGLIFNGRSGDVGYVSKTGDRGPRGLLAVQDGGERKCVVLSVQ